MTEAKYTVKFYGHMKADEDQFRLELARVLQTDAESAAALVRNPPTDIRRGMSKEQAERLQDDLSSVGALCLIEPEDHEQSLEPSPVAPLRTAPPPAVEPDSGPNLRNAYLWAGFAGGLLLVVLIIASLSFFSTFRKMREDNRATSGAPISTESRAPTETVLPPTPSISRAVVQERIDTVQEEIREIRFRMQLKDDEIKASFRDFKLDHDAVRRDQRELEMLRQDLRTHLEELKHLQGQLSKATAQENTGF